MQKKYLYKIQKYVEKLKKKPRHGGGVTDGDSDPIFFVGKKGDLATMNKRCNADVCLIDLEPINDDDVIYYNKVNDTEGTCIRLVNMYKWMKTKQPPTHPFSRRLLNKDEISAILAVMEPETKTDCLREEEIKRIRDKQKSIYILLIERKFV